MLRLANFINGQFVPPTNAQYFDNFNPATGEIIAQVPNSNATDIDAAVVAARAAFPEWARMKAEQRAALLNAVADKIDEKLTQLADIESKDNGKPLALARRMDIPRAAANFRFFATGLLHFSSDAHATDTSAINYTLRQPIGVVGCISPWNLPLYLFTWKIAPALAAGNCVIAKPSELTPMTAHALCEIMQEVGIPPGVFNLVHGRGPEVGGPLTIHPEVKAISFTGGTKTGAEIARVAGPMFKKLSLELGGKNPSLIFADCEYDKMLSTVVRSSFTNQGQICLCSSRLLIERSIYERFKNDFIAKVNELKVGDPLDSDTNLGAVVSREHQQKVLAYIQLAKEEGGVVLAGGHAVQVPRRCANGVFIAPTIIEGLTQHCRTNQEEIFGPVVTIQPFDTEQEMLVAANAVPYGLSATIWTQNLNRTHRLAQQVEAGVVWVNTWLNRDLRTPFGGYKASGVGREGGWEAMRFFTEAKNVCIEF